MKGGIRGGRGEEVGRENRENNEGVVCRVLEGGRIVVLKRLFMCYLSLELPVLFYV